MREKFFSIICAFSLLINSLFPIFSVGAVYAEDSTGSATVASPSPAASETPSPTPDSFVTPAPDPTPQVSPSSEPTPIISPSPEISPEPIVSTIPSTEPENTPTPTPDENIGQPNAPPGESPSPALTPEPSPSEDVEQAPTGHIFATILENTDAETLELDLSTQNDISSATLTTDKADYAPTDTVVISGSDFLPDTTYTLVISSSDPPAVNFQEDITTNDQGSFIYSYQLDGNYRPNYSVKLKDSAGNIVAMTTFTDAPISETITDSDGANDEPGQKDLNQMYFNYTNVPTSVDIAWNWDDAGFPGANTGDACALFDTDADGYANYALCVTVDNDPSVYQTTSLYSCNDTRSDRCPGEASISPFTSTCGANVQSTDPFPGPPAAKQGDDYPDDTVASCTAQLSEVGGSSSRLLDVCSFPSSISHSDPSDCIVASTASQTGLLEVKKVLSPTTDTGLFNLQIDGTTYAFDASNNGSSGEKVVDAGNHTVGETAGTSTGLSNYTSTIVCKGNNGTGSIVAQSADSGPLTVNVANNSDIVCTITNTRINNGSITVVKDAQPNDAQDFAFTTSGPGLSSFSLDDDSDSTLSNTKVFSSLASGTYSVSEGGVTGWTSDGGICSDGSLVSAISLQAGENITCTFTNTRDTGTIELEKIWSGTGGQTTLNIGTSAGGTQIVSQLTGAAGATPLTTGTQTVNTGTYFVSEAGGLTDYNSSLTCTDNGSPVTPGTNNSLSVTTGHAVICTFTNTLKLTHLTLVKTVSTDNGGSAAATAWTLSASGPTPISGVTGASAVTNGVVGAGSYTLSESGGPTGYTAGTYSCVKNTGAPVVSNSISLAPGDNATCTINNDDNAPVLHLRKTVTNNNGGSAVNTAWTLTATGTGGSPTNLSGTTPVNSNASFKADTYTLSETGGPSGYTASQYSCVKNSSAPVIGNSITLGVEDTAICTITNDDQSGTLIVKKIVTNDNGGTKGVADFSFQVNGGSETAFEVDGQNDLTVNAGTYNISEPAVTGYTTTYDNCSSVQVSNGGSATCTITNNDNPPSLTLVKQVTNNNGGNAQPSGWTLTASGPTGFSGPGPSVSSDVSFEAGTYNLSESGGPAGYSASSWSCQGGTQDGSHITLNLGESATCTITNDDQSASITLIKEVINNNGGNAGPDDFGISIGGQVVNSGTTLDVNSYTPIAIDEAGLSGYTFVSITGDNKCPTTLGGTVALNEGEDITCTITNDDQPAHLKVIKHVVKDNGGAAEASDFTMTINGVVVQGGGSSFNGEEAPGTVRIVEPGTYSVTESGPDGYQSNFSGDCSGTISLGQNVTCTITNDDITPSLTLIKYLPNDNGGTATESDFNVYINGQITSWGQRNLNAGQYTISEDTLIGYTPSAWGGDCDVDGTITLNPGDNKICTITNDDVAPALTLVKNLPNNNGGTATQDDFNVYINEEEADWGQNIVDAGDLTVSEDTLPGYEPSGWGGDCDEDGNITLLPGDNKTCTITNDDQPAHLILVKNLPNDNGGTATQDDFDVFIDGQEVVWDDNEVNVGSHTVNENTLPGYTPSVWGQDCDENGNVTLLPGETKTCTITNDDVAPILTLVKNLPNDNGGTATEDDFNVYINNELSFWGEHTLSADSYTISEDTISGYTPSAWGTDCAENGTITLNVGDEKTCSITNDDEPGKISGKKFNDKNGDHIRTNTTTDPNLPDWTIILDKVNDINPPVCTGGTIVGELCVTTTNSFGNYAFSGLEPGTYLVSEDLQTGWVQTRPGLFNETLYGGQGAQADGTYLLILQSGDDIDDRDFGNQGQGTITVHKNVDTNGDGEVDEENVTDWTWDINQAGDFATGDNSQEVSAGTYTISEDQKENYHVTSVECDNEESYDLSESIEVTVEAGQDLVCTFTNTRDTGTITILKNIDNNEDGDTNDEGDVRGAENWTWNILDGDQDIATGQTKTLPTGNYTITEDQQDSYNLLGWSCSNEQTGTENSINIELTKDAQITCTFTNQLLPPVLTLTKANNRTGIDVSAGADVLYTLTVTLTGSPLSNVSLIDLPPADFKYRSGSWTAVSSERGDLKPAITTEPTYASPGTWSLGDMVTGETITLTYIADIDTSTDPGLYKDLAWSSGEGQTSSTVLANENSGFFVGTEVNVVAGSGDSAGVNVVREERGEVLGVSTELPQTGINTIWSILAVLLLASGAGLIFAGISLRRKYE